MAANAMQDLQKETADAVLRLRMGPGEARYAGGLVDGASIAALFGDLATEIAIRHDGDEGLFRAYDSFEFLSPVRLGDYIEARGRLTRTGRTSRKIAFEAWKQVECEPLAGATAGRALTEPVLVARALGTVVVPLERQRFRLSESR
jgi:3-aminobutyryl-CoA ammonia-lyase